MSENNMRCEEFESRLNDYLDGALPEDERAQMLHHAQSCAPCGQLLHQMTDILGALHDMDRDTQMPLACQAAWRKAVRAECKAKRRTPALRAVTSVAAALVLLISGTFYSRLNTASPMETPTLNPVSSAVDPVPMSYTANHGGYRSDLSGGVQQARSQRIVSDGPVDDNTATVSPEASPEATTDRLQNTAAPEDTVQSNRPMLAYSAQLSVVSEDFEADVMNLSDLVQEFEGYDELSSQSGEEGARKLNMVIRVPAGRLDEFVEAVSNLGTVTLKERRAEDLSSSYYDTESRIESLEAQLSRLNELMQTAQLSDITTLSEQIAQVQEELDTLNGQRAGYDNSLSYARVTVDLSEGDSTPASSGNQPSSSGSGLTDRMSAAFTESVNGMGGFLEEMCVNLACWAPYIALLIPPVLLIWCIVVLIRRKRK